MLLSRLVVAVEACSPIDLASLYANSCADQTFDMVVG